MPSEVGCRTLEIMDVVQGVPVPSWALYPTRTPARRESFGPYELDVARDAMIEGERLPLVVISHGDTGSPWTYRGLAAHLARAGFVVAMLEHPGNSRSDRNLTGTVANLENRPRHIGLAIDAIFAHAAFGNRMMPAAVAVIGHSIGAYTALAVAGGQPWCSAHEAPDGKARAALVARDPRVSALVLLAPASGWFLGEGALAAVDLPILMYSGDRDEVAPAMHAELVVRGVAQGQRTVPITDRVIHRVIPGAGHFSFQSPFPAAMMNPGFAPSQDPPGFDRAALQPLLHAEILAFLRTHLGNAPG